MAVILKKENTVMKREYKQEKCMLKISKSVLKKNTKEKNCER